MNLLLPFSLCVVSTLASGLVSHGAAVSSYIYLDEYSVLSDGTIRDDQGWLKTDGAFTNVFRDDSGLLNLLGVTADTIASFAGRPVLREDTWNAYATAGILPASWLRSAQSYSFLDSSVVIVSIKGTTYQGPPITIIDQPVSQTVLQGDNGDFFCFAQPWETLSYQWRFKGKNILGATTEELRIPNVSKANAGIYQLALSTGGKPVLSDRVYLKMALPVVLKTQPKSQTVKAGHGVALRATAKGTSPFSYFWYKDGNMLPHDFTKSVFTIPHVDPTNAGTYYVQVFGYWNIVTSTNAVLTVVP